MAEAPVVRRVLVALDALSRSEAALRTAGALAAELNAELAGLFVEDADLARLFALPFARELCVLSGEVRPLSPVDLERNWRREAAMLEQRLAAAAGELRLRWSFRVRRGRMAAALSVDAPDFDLVVLGERSAALPQVPGVFRRGGPVLVPLVPGAGDDAVRLASRLARRSGAELVILVPSADEPGFAAACQGALRAAAADGSAVRCVRLQALDPASLLRSARDERASCLVLGGRARDLRSDEVLRLIERAGCPVVLTS